MRTWFFSSLAALALLTTTAAMSNPTAPVTKVSRPFSGAKVNGGTVSMTVTNGRIVLTLSDEVMDPKTPDPHWQVVDSKGQVYLLDKMTVKGDRLNKTITLPAYITSVDKVVIYCAWAEANLGEAAFQ